MDAEVSQTIALLLAQWIAISNIVMKYVILPIVSAQMLVYTIGCFDLFHIGHQNVLASLREFGYFIVAGIHDYESYFQLKNKYTIDNLEARMNNLKPFVDQLFVIPQEHQRQVAPQRGPAAVLVHQGNRWAAD